MNAHDLKKLSRIELHEKVWSTPGAKLSLELGVSDVAIAKRCRKLNIPIPSRRYWAKVDAGKNAKRRRLPPPPEDVFIAGAKKPVRKSLPLPSEGEPLHPLAVELAKAIESAELSYDKKRVMLKVPVFPKIEISKALGRRAAEAFHVILKEVEARDIPFRRSLSRDEGGYFEKERERLYFEIKEELIDDPTKSFEKEGYYRRWQEDRIPSGKLAFVLSTQRWGRSDAKEWSEDGGNSLRVILAEIVRYISNYYVDLYKRREAEAIELERKRVEAEIRRKKDEEEAAVRRQEEAKKRHAESLKATEYARRSDFVKAIGWWHLHQVAVGFIAECDRRWRNAQAGALTTEQEKWITWAREEASNLSPFEAGYPDPALDGAFDPESVPFGGPYPARRFPHPPTMPEIPAPVVVQQGYGQPSYHPPSTPYPFWLRYPRR